MSPDAAGAVDRGTRVEHDPHTAAGVLDRCELLNRFSAHPARLERVYLSAQHRAANDAVDDWMRYIGMATWVDAAGNQWGRFEGREPGLPALVLGSHLDTVPDAGSYDGMLGVTMALAVAERLMDRVHELPFALEIVGFSDEEGTRFGKALLGSSAAAGLWDEDWWDLRDKNGTTLLEAFRQWGLDPRKVGAAARRPEDVVAYLEAHIEQGPYLEAADASLGFVTTIAGARRFVLSIVGEARHAGGTPYERRKDALVGASMAITQIEKLAREAGVIATCGQINVVPGGVNVIPGRADFSLDLRHPSDQSRDAMWDTFVDVIGGICAERGLKFEWVETHSAPAMPCAPWLQNCVIEGIKVTADEDPTAAEPMGLWSRAGHDGMAFGHVTEIGMLFVRCFDGISHHPGEDVREIDVARGLDALTEAVLAVARRVEVG